MTGKHLTTAMTPELCCSDLKISLPFYTEILGFGIQYQREEDGFAMIERQGSRIMLDEIRGDSVTGTDRTMNTDKIDELYDRVQKSGANVFLPIEETWYRADDVELGSRQFIVLDPDGYMLRFSQALGERKSSASGPAATPRRS
jgi:uncharacterized glyoxalase superfamily protein PhnB